MNAALPVLRITSSQEENLSKVLSNIHVAAAQGSDIVFFAETTISGLIPNDNPAEMLSFAQEIPGPITKRLSAACVAHAVWVSIGLLEKEGERLFDTVVLIAPDGEIKLKYRRISPRWHWSRSDPNTFCQGDSVEYADIDFGRMSTLICGDFFDEEGQLQAVSKLKPDFVHLALVRSGEVGESYDQEKWDVKDFPEYAAQALKLGATVFAVNYIDGVYFGGAWVFLADGAVAASLHLWEEGILYWELLA